MNISVSTTRNLTELRRAVELDGNDIANYVESVSAEESIDHEAVSLLIRNHSFRVEPESIQRIQDHAHSVLTNLVENRQFEIAKNWLHLASEMDTQLQVRSHPGAGDGQKHLDE